MSQRALLTGGAGFIGLHLAKRLLTAGYTVDLVDNFSRGVQDKELRAVAADERVRLISCDVTDRAAFDSALSGAQPGLIFHLAAIIGVANVLKRPYEVLVENVRMLANVLEFAKSSRELKRFVFASTSEVYAGTLQHFDLPVPTPESSPLTVTDVAHPRASYMLSKIYGEAMCQHSDVPFTIVRPHNFYGPRMGMAHVVPELLKKAHFATEGSSLEVASPSHRRAFCYIEDAVEMMVRAAEAPACRGATLNIGNQTAEVTIEQVATVVLETTNKKLEIVRKPDTPGSPTRRCPEMSLTTKLTGHAARVDLAEGVRRTYSWYREHVFEGREPSAA